MMLMQSIVMTGRLGRLALALLIMGAGLPANAQYVKGVTGAGLYDFLIPTNCFAVSAQSNTRTPYWLTDGTYPDNRVPLLATGTSTGIVRTVDLADQVSFLSSNPAVIPPPAKIQAVGAIGGVGYQPTNVNFRIQEPARPTDVDVTAVGSVNSVIGMASRLGQPKRVVRKFRVYPPQKISKATIAPAKPAPYKEGERLRVDVALPWKIPFSTTTVVIGMPVYKNVGGSAVSARLPEWKTSSGTYLPRQIDVPPNANTVGFEFAARFPSDAAVERLAPVTVQASFSVPVQLKTHCQGLTTNPTSVDISYKMQKSMNMPTQPATSPAPSPVQQAPLQQPGNASAEGGVLAPRDPLPTKPDAEPENYPKPRPRQ